MSKNDDLQNPGKIDFEYIDKVRDQAAQTRPTVWRSIKALFRHAAQTAVVRPPVLHYISDNGGYPDTATPEIVVRLSDAGALFNTISARPQVPFKYHNIPAQDPYAAAFDLAQKARGAVRGFGNIYFVNCAPRKKERGKESHNGGESIYVGILPNGAIVSGTGPDVFMLFRDLVESRQLRLFRANVATNGTQFRSRDYFPWLATVLANYINRPDINRKWKEGLSISEREAIIGGLSILDRNTTLKVDEIPVLPNEGAVVLRADVHKNLKLGIRFADLEQTVAAYQEQKLASNGHAAGPEVIVYANGRILPASLATHSFDKQEGQTALSGGSSGRWPIDPNRETSPYVEIFTVDGEAREELGITDRQLRNGVEVNLIPAFAFNVLRFHFASDTRLGEWTDQQMAKAIVDAQLVRGLTVLPMLIEETAGLATNSPLIEIIYRQLQLNGTEEQPLAPGQSPRVRTENRPTIH